jgi:hypothetical protein
MTANSTTFSRCKDEIGGAVVRALKVTLLEGESPSATPTTSIAANDLYLQAGPFVVSNAAPLISNPLCCI